MYVELYPSGRVVIIKQVDVPLPAGVLWGQMRDIYRFATRDLFHRRFRIDGRIPRQGASIVIEHGFGLLRLDRVGRILQWQENRGYAFSDLSRHGHGRGFPHIYRYRVEPIAAESCRLTIEVRGRWTARWIPPCVVRLWLRAVIEASAAILNIEIHAIKTVYDRSFGRSVPSPVSDVDTRDGSEPRYL